MKKALNNLCTNYLNVATKIIIIFLVPELKSQFKWMTESPNKNLTVTYLLYNGWFNPPNIYTIKCRISDKKICYI